MPTIPRREDELQRPRSRKSKDALPVTHGVMRPVSIPRADPEWHPIAKRLYNSLKTSGQSDYYQNSDWAMAFSLCDDLSRYKKQEDQADALNEALARWHEMTGDEREEAGFDRKRAPRFGGKGGSAMKLNGILDALGSLMVTEGDRRRLRLELQQPQPEQTPASVTAINDYRAGLGLEGGQ